MQNVTIEMLFLLIGSVQNGVLSCNNNMEFRIYWGKLFTFYNNVYFKIIIKNNNLCLLLELFTQMFLPKQNPSPPGFLSNHTRHLDSNHARQMHYHCFAPETAPVLQLEDAATGLFTHSTFGTDRQIAFQPLMRHSNLQIHPAQAHRCHHMLLAFWLSHQKWEFKTKIIPKLILTFFKTLSKKKNI